MWILSAFCECICIPWILSAFCGNIHVTWILSAFCGYYTNFVDTVRTVHIMSYLSCNVRHVLHSSILVVGIILVTVRATWLIMSVLFLTFYSSSESDWCITPFPACNVICLYDPSYLCPFRFCGWVKKLILTLSGYMCLL